MLPYTSSLVIQADYARASTRNVLSGSIMLTKTGTRLHEINEPGKNADKKGDTQHHFGTRLTAPLQRCIHLHTLSSG